MANTLTINYYSNYANVLYKKLYLDQERETIILDSTQNELIHSDFFTYGYYSSDFFRSYDINDSNASLQMERYGYQSGYRWNTKPDGTGLHVHEYNTAFYAEEVAAFFGYDLNVSDVTINLYAEWGRENALIINYYSNYANDVYDKTIGGAGYVELDSTQNIHIHADSFPDIYYSNDFFRNYDGNIENATLLMTKKGYVSTGYWNTSPNGDGLRIHQSETMFTNARDVAIFFGYNLLEEDATIDLYPEWVPLQIDIYFDGTIQAMDFIQDNDNYIDMTNMTIHAISFIENSEELKWTPEGLFAKNFTKIKGD